MSTIVIKNKCLFISILFIVLLTGCGRSSSNQLNEYNLMITNHSPLHLKSVVVTFKEKDGSENNSLIDNDINYNDIAKFHMGSGKKKFKITINPKNNYSVSKEFSDTFNTKEIVEYQIKIESNEVIIQKVNK